MTEDYNEEDSKNIQEFASNFTPLKDFEGAEYYFNFRNIIFNSIITLLQNEEKANSIQKVHSIMDDGLGSVIDLGFIHNAYKYNFILSTETIINNWGDDKKIKELISAIDEYVIPKSKTTQDFLNCINKASAGALAYILMKQGECSENLAVWISKQIFDISSEQTVYSALKEFKDYKFTNNEVPSVIYLIVFYLIFYSEVEFSEVKPRAKHERSIKELNKAIDSIENIRKQIILREIESSQNALKKNKEKLTDLFDLEFMDKVLEFKVDSFEFDNEAVVVVLLSSILVGKMGYIPNS